MVAFDPQESDHVRDPGGVIEEIRGRLQDDGENGDRSDDADN